MKLSTGKEIYANNGILGINPDADYISEGYDGGVCGVVTGEYDEDLTADEKIEIANIAIKRWEAFKEKVLNNSGQLPQREPGHQSD